MSINEESKEPNESKGTENGQKDLIDMVEVTLRNKARVLFKSPVVKFIVSHHSGSILSNGDPTVKVDQTSREKILQIFSTYESSEENGGVSKSVIPEILRKCGYEYGDDEQFRALCFKLYTGPDYMDEKTFIQFFELFQAPGSYKLLIP